MKTVMADRRWIGQHRDLGTEPVSTETCTSADFFELERERIFRRLWINMGREDQIPEPGDYVVKDFTMANASVLLVRGKDMKVRAFHNICVHRGNRLVGDEKGTCKNLFVCRFHSWAFSPEGDLKWVSDESNFYDLDKNQLGLRPIATSIWQGFIFINLSPNPAETLLQYLDGVTQQTAGYPFNELSVVFRYRVDERSNWKVVLDAQNEVYHLPFLHIAYPDFCPLNERGFSRIQDFRRFGRHTVYSVEANGTHQATKVEQVTARIVPYAEKPGTIAWFDFYTIFPNMCILFLGNTCMTYNIWPIEVDRSVWEVTIYQPKAATASERFVQEYWACRLRDLLQEDASNHEAIQASLKSGALTHFQLQDEEIQIRHFHKMIREQVAQIV
ncbi:MAG TPA: aromatic ring-hydroxylating dioxygenase subunit alpha [Candidatus Binataceae bacterium]|jgi:phenylpropionate dioxygenase-like ring-hydroxylating dioxygenase large terminal subunit|nr:aromatic ring-hydroxylating dioxygenase subunit alpha [Candidatus Binataceae bacterium]